MGGTPSPGGLTAAPLAAGPDALGFRLAAASDDAALRRLLRSNPMKGEIVLSLEREPSFFRASDIEGPRHDTIVATVSGRVVCAGSVSERDRFVNGSPVRVGYLGGLRLDASWRGHGSILRHGYEFFRGLHERGGPRFYLTSIAADNVAARRILERGLPGMPIYRRLEPFTTIVLGSRRRRRVRAAVSAVLGRAGRDSVTVGPGGPQFVDEIVSLLNESNRRYQFAPHWTARDLLSQDRCPGLRLEDFRLAWIGPRLVGCAALWDQRAVKQTVVRQYGSRVDRWRRLARILPGIRILPEPGSVLAHGYVSHMATAEDHDGVLAVLVESLRSRARSSGLDYLTLGFASRDQRLATFRQMYRCRVYRSVLYTVHWPEDPATVGVLDGRVPAPEIAIL